MKTSVHIGRKQVTNMTPAQRLAEKLGFPLNTLVTINFDHTDCAPEQVGTAFAKLRAYFGRWPGSAAARSGKKTPPTFEWVVENANSLAAHWLVHIPLGSKRDFKERLPVWLTRATGGITCPSAIDIRPAHHPKGLIKYLKKGVDPAYADHYRVTAIPQGLVHGKRCGFSQNLGPAACRQQRTYWTQIKQDRARNHANAHPAL